MRIIGEIDHPKYKITILKMNEKITVQIEDRLVSQSYSFRDGSGVSDLASVSQLLTLQFMDKVQSRFEQMHQDYIGALEAMATEEIDDFEII